MPSSAHHVYEVPPTKPPVPCVDLPPIPGAGNPGTPTTSVCQPPPVDNAGMLPATGLDALIFVAAAAVAAAVGFALRRLSSNKS